MQNLPALLAVSIPSNRGKPSDALIPNGTARARSVSIPSNRGKPSDKTYESEHHDMQASQSPQIGASLRTECGLGFATFRQKSQSPQIGASLRTMRIHPPNGG